MVARRPAQKKRIGGKKKRWYVNATATLPFIGKTGVSFGSGQQKRSLQQAKQFIRRTITQAEELKRVYLASPLNLGGITHNTWWTYNIGASIPFTGATLDRDTMLGHKVKTSSIELKLKTFKSNTTGNPIWFKIALVSTPTKLSNTTNTVFSGLGNSDLIHKLSDGTYPINLMMTKFDTSKCNVHWQHKEEITPKTPNPDVAGTYIYQSHSKISKFNIPFNHTFTIDTSSKTALATYDSYYFKDRQYYFVMCVYEDGGTTGNATNFNIYESTMDLHFKEQL